ncbi:MAG: tetratricopeptide repeat protein [Myxacorys chilensis ATA2-1-KO14]|nr:tetratricopeptide repeat protein [Myxacorys chilensis ATA2-1-KO14]
MARRSLRLLVVLVSLLLLLGQPPMLALGTGRELLPASQPEVEASEQVFPDYLQRSEIISTYEEQVRQSPDSFLLLRLLAAQYLRRFRERADVDDLLRAEQAARRSLAIQPRRNVAASMLLASALLSQHQFREALQVAIAAEQIAPNNANLVSLKASIQMELGDYNAAQQLLQTLTDESESGHSAVAARYLELTYSLAAARKLMDSTMQQVDAFYTNPAETCAWFHVRSGDLAFLSGDLSLAERRYREALDLFPDDIAAFTGLARLYAAQHRWQASLEAANQGIERSPLVETLGYKADAQRALGDPEGATATEALIDVVAHLSRVQGIYDRALAVYYIEHNIHLPEALDIAQREVSVRDDIYAEDTLAWAAAANGQWQIAQQAAQQAIRYGTEDPLLQFHSGMIALHSGDLAGATQHLQQALSLNPQFHHKYATEARQVLVDLTTNGDAQQANSHSPLILRNLL